MKLTNEPIIIIGMHRSGTSLLSNILMDEGVFMGSRLESNEESVYFLKLNNSIFKQFSITWDNPTNYLKVSDKSKDFFIHLFKKKISSFCFNKFTRFKRPKYWGWKDPRNSFTLDIWSKIFPEARIIHVIRNPIDVGLSLHKRENNKFQSVKKKLGIINKYKTHFSQGSISGISHRCLNFDESINLWNEYLQQIESFENDNKLKILTIKYEDLINDFENQKATILNHCKIDLNTVPRKKQTKIKNRAYNFLEDDKLMKLALDLKRSNEFVIKYKYYNDFK